MDIRSIARIAVQWGLGLAMVTGMVVAVVAYYRGSYVYDKRFRVVDPGKFYRSGRMTAQALKEKIERYGIRTVINLMDEEADPQLLASAYGRRTESEKKICRDGGVRYVFLPVEVLPEKHRTIARPSTIDTFLRIMDDPQNHPVLLHCRAGLHRTGILSAIYRMEYQGWTPSQAWHELRRLGFGESTCFADNPYIVQYIFSYKPGLRQTAPRMPNGASFFETMELRHNSAEH